MKFTIFNILNFLLFGLFFYAQATELGDLSQELEDLLRQEAQLKERKQAIKERIEALNNQKVEKEGSVNSTKPENLAGKKPNKKTSASLSYYWDNREFNTLNLLTSTTTLPYDFGIWGFIDLHGAHDSGSTDLSRYFIEYRLSRKIDLDWLGDVKGLGFQSEFNDANGGGNNLVRFGLTYRHDLPELFDRRGWLQWRGFPVETDGSGQQASLIYFLPFHERAWVSGFADINFRESQSDVWVIEPQLTIKLDDRFSLLVEYRYNGFEDLVQTIDGEGVAFGLELSF